MISVLMNNACFTEHIVLYTHVYVYIYTYNIYICVCVCVCINVFWLVWFF